MLIVQTHTEKELRSRDATVENLIFRISQGDISAMGDLYELTETDIYAYALSKTENKEWAEDITHDTFVQIWKNSPKYTPMGKPLSWMFTIEMNLIRRQYNLSRRFTSLDESIEVESDERDLSQSVIDSEFIRQIMQILTEEEREIISLHIISGLKHREIAKLFGKPLSTVLSKYNRAIKKLQAQIKEKEEW